MGDNEGTHMFACDLYLQILQTHTQLDVIFEWYQRSFPSFHDYDQTYGPRNQSIDWQYTHTYILYIIIYIYTHIIIYNMYIVFKYVLHLGWWSPTQMAGEDGSEAVLVDICERQLMLVHESRGAIWWRGPKTHRIPRWHNLTPLEAIINSATGGMGCV